MNDIEGYTKNRFALEIWKIVQRLERGRIYFAPSFSWVKSSTGQLEYFALFIFHKRSRQWCTVELVKDGQWCDNTFTNSLPTKIGLKKILRSLKKTLFPLQRQFSPQLPLF